jgi:hypothetical protein
MPPKNHECAALFHQAPNRIPSESVPRVNSYADDIPGCDGGYIQRLECFVTENRVAKFVRRGRGQNEQPTWGDNGSTESRIAWVNKMHSQIVDPFLRRTQRLARSQFFRRIFGRSHITPWDLTREGEGRPAHSSPHPPSGRRFIS